MKIERKLTCLIFISFVVGIIFFWFLPPDGAMFYSLAYFCGILPIELLILGFILRYSYKLNIICIIFIGGIVFLSTDYFTFMLANMINNARFAMPRFEYFIQGAFVILLGAIIGIVIKGIRKRL